MFVFVKSDWVAKTALHFVVQVLGNRIYIFKYGGFWIWNMRMDKMGKVDEMKIVTGDVAGEEKRRGDRDADGIHQVDGMKLPRVSIQFCTQCKWMLRAAYVCFFLLSFVACFFFS